MANANIILNWSANPASNFVTLYDIHMSVNGGAFSPLAETPNLTYTVNNQPSAVYRFKIRAKNFVGTGPFGPEGVGPTDVPDAPSAPTVTVVVL